MDEVIGVYLVGSATRPFRDPLSDHDFEVVMDDKAFAKGPGEKKLVFVLDEGPPRRVDHEFSLRPWTELARLVRSTLDLDHYPFQHARVLHAPTGRLGELVEHLAALPASVRKTRLRVHYLEFRFGSSRAGNCLDRCGTLNARLILGESITALVKLLSLVKRSWPSTRHGSTEELELLGVGPDLIGGDRGGPLESREGSSPSPDQGGGPLLGGTSGDVPQERAEADAVGLPYRGGEARLPALGSALGD